MIQLRNHLNKRQTPHHLIDCVTAQGLRDHRVPEFIPKQIQDVRQWHLNVLSTRVQRHDLIQLFCENSTGHDRGQIYLSIFIV